MYISINHRSVTIFILCLYMLEEKKSLILTSLHVPKLRYGAHARKFTPLKHCTESVKRDDIETSCLYMTDEHNCLIVTS